MPGRASKWGRDEHAADRESVAHALGHGNKVGPYAGLLVGEEAPRAAVARLDLVQNELRARLGGYGAQLAQEVVRGAVDARHALDALDDHGGEEYRERYYDFLYCIRVRDLYPAAEREVKPSGEEGIVCIYKEGTCGSGA